MPKSRGISMALGAGISFILMVAGVQVLAPAIKPVDPYGISGAHQKIEQMEQVASGPPVDLVFTGTSQMLVSVDPEIVDATSGIRSYNASLTGGTPRFRSSGCSTRWSPCCIRNRWPSVSPTWICSTRAPG